MARIRQSITLGHRANIGEDVQQVELGAGDEVTILAEWAETYLCRDGGGRLFHVPKDCVDAT